MMTEKRRYRWLNAKAILSCLIVLTMNGALNAKCYPTFYIKGGNKSINLISKTDLNKSLDIMIVGTEPDSLLKVKVSVAIEGVIKQVSDSWQDGISEKIKTTFYSNDTQD